MCGGLDTPTAGDVFVSGHNLSRMECRRADRVPKTKHRIRFPELQSHSGSQCLREHRDPLDLDGNRIDGDFLQEVVSSSALETS